MKVSGTATLHATPDRVYAALNDPAVLVRTIPGCERLEAVGPDRYRMTVTAGVASIKGSYLGDVRLSDGAPPSSFTLTASGSGAPGTVTADVRVHLDDAGDGTTVLRYDADAVVGGPVGGVGQRVLTGVARKTAAEFFAAVDAALAAGPDAADPGTAAVPGPAPSAPSAGAAAAPSAAAPSAAVFTRPAGPPGGVTVDVRSQLAGVLVGAAVALAGVWIGFRIGRRFG